MVTAKHVLTLALAAGCASTPHTTPSEMSAADHQEEAAREAAEARALAREEPATGREDASNETASIQTAQTNEHWHAAAAHGAAAKALFAAERTACEGISGADQAANPFQPTDRIVSVTRLLWHSKDAPAGAAIAFRTTAGVDQEKLRRKIQCHGAHAATLGYRGPGLDESPLALKGVSSEIISSSDGLILRIIADDPSTAREIIRRAEALMK